MNKINKNILIVVLVIINLVLIFYGGGDKGRAAFISVPILLLLDIIFLIFSIISKNQKLIYAAILLITIAPILALVVFAYNFPFLTR